MVVAISFYLPSLDNPLIWDDEIHVSRVPTMSVADAFSRIDDQYRRPVVLLSYKVQSSLGLGSDGALHSFNVIVHGANAALLYLLLARIGLPLVAAFAAALIFTVHPLQSAAVAYVSGRTDLLALLFTLVAVRLAAATARRTTVDEIVRAAGVALCVALAAGAKESGLVAGVLAAALWWSRRGEPDRPGLAFPVAALLTTAAFVVPVVPPALFDGAGLDLATRLRGAGTAFATYVRLLVLPRELHLDRLTTLGGQAYFFAGVGVALALVWAVVGFVRAPGRVRFGGLALAMLYLPASALVPVYPAVAARWLFTPEHFMYAPIAAIAAFICLDVKTGIDELASRYSLARYHPGAVAVVALSVVVAALSAGPVLARQAVLASAETAYRNTLAYSPSPRACFNLGVALLARDQADEAVSIYERCARVSPNDSNVFVQLGVAYQRGGKTAEAAFAYEKALALDSGNTLAWSNYASLEANKGAYAQAREKWRKALAIDPEFKPALDGMAGLEQALPPEL